MIIDAASAPALARKVAGIGNGERDREMSQFRHELSGTGAHPIPSDQRKPAAMRHLCPRELAAEGHSTWPAAADLVLSLPARLDTADTSIAGPQRASGWIGGC